MTVLVSDSFNRANSTTTLGTTDSYNGGTAKTWSSATTYGISSNQAQKQTASATLNSSAWVDGGVSDGKVTITFATLGNHCRLMFRRTDDSNCFYVYANGTTNYQLIKRQGSANTVIATISVVPANGDLISVTFNGSSITTQINGANDSTVTNTFNQTATQVGFITDDSVARLDNFILEDLTTGGTVLTLSLSDAITLGESFTEVRSGKLTLTDSINATDSKSITSTRFLSLVDAITTSESFTKRRQAYLSLTDGLNIGDTETSTRATINTLVRALSDSINITDSITIRAMRYLTIFDLFSIVDSLNTTGGGNVAQTIKFKRGNEVDLPTLAEGEPAVTLDTNKMFVGTPNGNIQIANLLVVDSIANLPVANKSKQFLIAGVLGASGFADALYVCKKLSNDTYDWVQFV